jgi:hypothetical protein
VVIPLRGGANSVAFSDGRGETRRQSFLTISHSTDLPGRGGVLCHPAAPRLPVC